MSKNKRAGIIAGGVGNVLEWYDFAVYGYFATIIASHFFPESDKVAGLIATFGIFAAGFVVRPLGGIIFGGIGDKYGRKKALTLSVFMMAIPTTLIGVLPTYESVGYWAPILLALLRIFQGISVGGELTGSIAYIAENSPQNKRGMYVSTTLFGAVLGMLLGSFVGMMLAKYISAEALHQWGWRLPFLAGLLIGVAGYFLRMHMEEGDSFIKLKEAGKIVKTPLKEFWHDYKGKAVLTVFALWAFSTSFYMIFLYLTSYSHSFLKFNLEDALTINTISMVFMLGLILLMGHLSDKIGRKKVLMGGLIAMLVFSIPLFMLIDKAEYYHILLAQLAYAIIVATQQGAIPATLVERFPTRVRYTGLSVAYNVALALFGGTTPMFATWLIHEFDGNVIMPCYYLMFVSLVSLIAISRFKETYKDPLS